MLKIHCYHINAFSNQLFAGNPAIVCILTEWLPDVILQTISKDENAFGGDPPLRRPTLALDLFKEVGFETLLNPSVQGNSRNNNQLTNLIDLLVSLSLSEEYFPAVRNVVTEQQFFKK